MTCIKLKCAIMFALLFATCAATPARAELIVNADLDPSQIGPLTFGGLGIAIPLPNFTLSGNEDTISIRFTNDQALHIVLPDGVHTTNHALEITLWGTTDGSGNDVGYSDGSVYLTDPQHQLLPNTTADAQYDNALLYNSTPIIYITSHLDASRGDVFQFSDVHLAAGHDFDAANITGALLEILPRADDGDGGPTYPAYGPVTIVTVPEPASLALLIPAMIGATGILRRRRWIR